MKVIYNRLIPFRGFKCINLFGILFVREGCVMTRTDFDHEAIYTRRRCRNCFTFLSICSMSWNGCAA